MAPHCEIFRGMMQEVEEEVNEFLQAHEDVRVLHMTQSESANYITISLIVEKKAQVSDPPAD